LLRPSPKTNFTLFKILPLKKTIIALFVLQLVTVGVIFAQNIDLENIRSVYSNSKESEKTSMIILSQLAKIKNPTPIEQAYHGAFIAVKANFSHNPFSKLSLVQKGMSEINNAITRDKANIEIRYLRYTIQNEMPSILKLSQNLSEDKPLLSAYADRYPDKELSLKIIGYFNLHSN
jgi:hypothetical protein